jgi:hypothetical protein
VYLPAFAVVNGLDEMFAIRFNDVDFTWQRQTR